MNLTIADHLPYVMSFCTVLVMVLSGNRWRWVWLLALINQALWCIWQYEVKAWGLFPMSVVLTCVYTRNHFKWNPSHQFWSRALRTLK